MQGMGSPTCYFIKIDMGPKFADYAQYLKNNPNDDNISDHIKQLRLHWLNLRFFVSNPIGNTPYDVAKINLLVCIQYPRI